MLKKVVITQPLPHQDLKGSGFGRRVISWAPSRREELLVNTAGSIASKLVLTHAALC
jgi:hypothetical protein